VDKKRFFKFSDPYSVTPDSGGVRESTLMNDVCDDTSFSSFCQRKGRTSKLCFMPRIPGSSLRTTE